MVDISGNDEVALMATAFLFFEEKLQYRALQCSLTKRTKEHADSESL